MAKNGKLLRDLLDDMMLPEVEHHPHAPKMPPDDRTNSAIPCLPFTPRSHRYLTQVHPISRDDFVGGINGYLDALPEMCVSSRDQRRFVLPEPGLMAWPSTMLMDENFRKFSDDVLGCVYSIVNFVDRETALHAFGAEKGGNMHCGWSNNNWGSCNPVLHRLTDVKIVTVSMPAWCFAPKDMADFTGLRTFQNPASLDQDYDGVSTAVKLWARLHDFCYLHDAHYFIVSTYEQWAFGSFSDQYSTGFVAPEMRWTDSSPNMFQAAMYWMHSAHGHAAGYKIPLVFAEPPKSNNDSSLHSILEDKRKGKGKRKDLHDSGSAGGDESSSKPSRRIFPNVPWLRKTEHTDEERSTCRAEFMKFSVVRPKYSDDDQNGETSDAVMSMDISLDAGGADFGFAAFPERPRRKIAPGSRTRGRAPGLGLSARPPPLAPDSTLGAQPVLGLVHAMLPPPPSILPISMPYPTSAPIPPPAAAAAAVQPDLSAMMMFTPVSAFHDFDVAAGLRLGEPAERPTFSTSMMTFDHPPTGATVNPADLFTYPPTNLSDIDMTFGSPVDPTLMPSSLGLHGVTV